MSNHIIRGHKVTTKAKRLGGGGGQCYQMELSKLAVYALSFDMTKTVLVGPEWCGSDQIDLDLTIMIWSRPSGRGHDQNELVRSKL